MLWFCIYKDRLTVCLLCVLSIIKAKLQKLKQGVLFAKVTNKKLSTLKYISFKESKEKQTNNKWISPSTRNQLKSNCLSVVENRTEINLLDDIYFSTVVSQSFYTHRRINKLLNISKRSISCTYSLLAAKAQLPWWVDWLIQYILQILYSTQCESPIIRKSK